MDDQNDSSWYRAYQEMPDWYRDADQLGAGRVQRYSIRPEVREIDGRGVRGYVLTNASGSGDFGFFERAVDAEYAGRQLPQRGYDPESGLYLVTSSAPAGGSRPPFPLAASGAAPSPLAAPSVDADELGADRVRRYSIRPEVREIDGQGVRGYVLTSATGSGDFGFFERAADAEYAGRQLPQREYDPESGLYLPTSFAPTGGSRLPFPLAASGAAPFPVAAPSVSAMPPMQPLASEALYSVPQFSQPQALPPLAPLMGPQDNGSYMFQQYLQPIDQGIGSLAPQPVQMMNMGGAVSAPMPPNFAEELMRLGPRLPPMGFAG
jgi:hypothetical protein